MLTNIASIKLLRLAYTQHNHYSVGIHTYIAIPMQAVFQAPLPQTQSLQKETVGVIQTMVDAAAQTTLL